MTWVALNSSTLNGTQHKSNLCVCVCVVFCRVYTPDHSYVTIRSRLSCRVGEILALVREKLQYSEDQPVLPGHLVLVAVTSSGGQGSRYVFTRHLFRCGRR